MTKLTQTDTCKKDEFTNSSLEGDLYLDMVLCRSRGGIIETCPSPYTPISAYFSASSFTGQLSPVTVSVCLSC